MSCARKKIHVGVFTSKVFFSPVFLFLLFLLFSFNTCIATLRIIFCPACTYFQYINVITKKSTRNRYRLSVRFDSIIDIEKYWKTSEYRFPCATPWISHAREWYDGENRRTIAVTVFNVSKKGKRGVTLYSRDNDNTRKIKIKIEGGGKWASARERGRARRSFASYSKDARRTKIEAR